MLLDSMLLEIVLDEFFCMENKRIHEPFDMLLQELLFCGIRTVGQLRDTLKQGLSEISRLESKQRKKHGKSFYSYTGKLRIALQVAFPELYDQLRETRMK